MSDMATPRFSIIIPAWQALEHIDGSIESALDQGGPEIEVIVVDDASPDGTAARVARWMAREPRLRLLRARENGGPARARNLGLDAARGDWVALLDSDDGFRPGRLARLASSAEAEGADLIADDLELVDGATGEPLGRALPPDLPALARVDAQTFIQRNRHRQAGFAYGYLKPLIRRSFLQRHGLRYRADLRIGEDYHLYLDCLLRGARFLIVNQALYRYRLMPGSISRRLGVADIERLQSHNRALLEGEVSLEPAVRAALIERAHDLERQAGHGRFVEFAKGGQAGHALGLLARQPEVVPLVLASAREGVLKRLGLLRFHGLRA